MQNCPEGYWPPNPNDNAFCQKLAPSNNGKNECPEGWNELRDIFG